MNYYLVFVLVVLVVCFILSDGIPAVFARMNKNFDPETKKIVGGWRWVIVVLSLLSPIIYEFKPFLDHPQYEIVRGVDGRVANLKKDGTGFHWPFFSGARFANIANIYEFNQTLNFPCGSQIMEIPYCVICKDPPKAFIATNGLITHSQDFENWFVKSFTVSMMGDPLVDEVRLPSKPAEAYDFVLKKSEEWARVNDCGCVIVIDKNSIKFNTPFWIKY